jgi:hypothetical protein
LREVPNWAAQRHDVAAECLGKGICCDAMVCHGTWNLLILNKSEICNRERPSIRRIIRATEVLKKDPADIFSSQT